MITVGFHVHLFVRAFGSPISISQADTFFSLEIHITEAQIEMMKWAQYISGIHLSINALIFNEFSVSGGSDNVVGGLRM